MNTDSFRPGLFATIKLDDDGKTITSSGQFGNIVVNKTDIETVSLTTANGFLSSGKATITITGKGSELAVLKNMPLDWAKKTKEWIESRLPEKEAEPATKNTDNDIEVLTKLKKMLDAELITQSEYDTKKVEILGRM